VGDGRGQPAPAAYTAGVADPAAAAGAAERARLLRLLRRPAAEAARGLLGCVLVRRAGGRLLRARVVETEAYLGPEDPAAHSYAGRTPRTEPLWGPPGTLYVYLVYGMHHCLNLAVDREGFPGCVLVRAAEPLGDGGLAPDACRGPGRLCRALGIDTRLSGRHLFEPAWALTLREGAAPPRVGVAPRVGITKAKERPLRFFDADSGAVSAPRPAGVSFAAVPRRSTRPTTAHAARRESR
jgi:DNA-3-methyladenine glycosylase